MSSSGGDVKGFRCLPAVQSQRAPATSCSTGSTESGAIFHASETDSMMGCIRLPLAGIKQDINAFNRASLAFLRTPLLAGTGVPPDTGCRVSGRQIRFRNLARKQPGAWTISDYFT